MKNANFKTIVRYEPEADVLSWELSRDKIVDATEMGNLVIHFNQRRQPVYVEMLQARSFIQKSLPVVRLQKTQHKEFVFPY